MIVREDVLTRWLREAKTGEVLVYARTTFLIPTGVTRRLYDLAASGHVALYQERRKDGAGDENFHYCARRLARPIDGPAPRRPVRHVGAARKPQDLRCSSHGALTREIEPQVRAMLAEGVGRNACAIARALGIYSSRPVQAVLVRMERMAA